MSAFASLTMLKLLTVWSRANCGKFLKRGQYQTTLPVSWETFRQIKKQQLELSMEQWTDSKLEKEYIKAVYCHPAYLPLCRLELLSRVRLCDPMDCSLPGSSLHGIFPGNSTGVGFLLQGIFRTQVLNPGLLHCRQTLYRLSHQGRHMKCQDGWSTSWNQDCWEKYQQLQMCIWCHYDSRKQGGTKEPLD